MQVILLEKVENLGNLGDVVKVKDGDLKNIVSHLEIYEWDAITELRRNEGHEDPDTDGLVDVEGQHLSGSAVRKRSSSTSPTPPTAAPTSTTPCLAAMSPSVGRPHSNPARIVALGATARARAKASASSPSAGALSRASNPTSPNSANSGRWRQISGWRTASPVTRASRQMLIGSAARRASQGIMALTARSAIYAFQVKILVCGGCVQSNFHSTI